MASDPAPIPGPVPSPGASAARLAEQLHTLAEVSETLTYRLIELEERLHDQEQRLQDLLPAVEAGEAQAAVICERLGETDERLERIEALLAGQEPGRMDRRLQPLRGFSTRRAGSPAHRSGDDPEGIAEDPFYDEGEQPFMDERTA